MACTNIHHDCAYNSKHVQRTWENSAGRARPGSLRAQEKLSCHEEVGQSLHSVLLLPQHPAAFPQLLAQGCLALSWLPQTLEMFLQRQWWQLLHRLTLGSTWIILRVIFFLPAGDVTLKSLSLPTIHTQSPLVPSLLVSPG